MEIEVARLSDIKPYYNNPRDNAKAIQPTMESIRRYGFVKPIMCDKEGVIICGHTRYLAAFRLNLEYVPVVYSDLSEEKAKQFRLADNKIAEKSEFDEDEMIAELRNMEVPESMQDFFFDDIRSMIDFDVNSLSSGITKEDYGQSGTDDFIFGEEPEEKQQAASEQSRTVENAGDTSQPSEQKEFDHPIYKPYMEDEVKKMKVICPYCGNVETIVLDV